MINAADRQDEHGHMLKKSTEHFLLDALNIRDFRSHYSKASSSEVVNSLEYVIADRMGRLLKTAEADRDTPSAKFYRQCLEHLATEYHDIPVNWDHVMGHFSVFFGRYDKAAVSINYSGADLVRIAALDFMEQTFETFDFNMKNSKGVNMLMLAMHSDNLSSGLISFLVDKGISVDSHSPTYGKPVHFINLENDSKAAIGKLMTLIKYGANPNEDVEFAHYGSLDSQVHAYGSDVAALFVNKNLKDFLDNRAVSANKGAVSDISKLLTSLANKEHSVRAIESMMNVPRKRSKVMM